MMRENKAMGRSSPHGLKLNFCRVGLTRCYKTEVFFKHLYLCYGLM